MSRNYQLKPNDLADPSRLGRGRFAPRGFTLIELLVVIAIVGILASIAVPSFKGLGQANRSAAAHRQILDDLSLARLRAINDRSPVYMVFAPTNLAVAFNRPSTAGNTPQARSERSRLTNLFNSQFSAYALVSERTMGDQPGRHTRRYLTEWKTLPDGMLFAPYKLVGPSNPSRDEYTRALPQIALPFPTSRSDSTLPLPYIGFNAQGQLLGGRDEVVTLAKGSVFLPKNPNGTLALSALPDVQLNPPVRATAAPATQTNNYQFVRINWLTGRAKVELPDFQ